MKKKMKRLMALLAAMVLIVSMLPAAALAADETEDEDTSSTPSYLSIDTDSKTITVTDDDSVTTEIQDAINYIVANYSSGDSVGDWTIVVNEGTYSRFFISEKYSTALAGLTVKAADDETVTINVFDGSTTPTGVGGETLTYSDTPDVGGVYINVPNVTISGLTFKQGSDTSFTQWYAAVISTYNNQGGTSAEGLTITDCTFKGDGTYYGIAINQIESWTVSGCTFDGFSQAIFFDENDAVGGDGITITGNTFMNCSFAVHGSFGYGTENVENNNGGKFTFDNNIVIGTSSLRCKVVVQDYYENGAVGSSSFSGNTLENAMIGLVNLTDVTVSDAEALKAANTLNENSYVVVTETENGDEGGYGATIYFSPESSHGYWALTNIADNNDLDVSWGGNAEGTDNYVKYVIDEANASGSHTLTFNVDTENLIRTFTWFKDAIYWVGSDEDEEEPDVEKQILVTETDDDGTETTTKTDTATAAAGETVTFELTVSAPEYLDIYGTTSEYDSIIRYPTYVGYVVTVHDEMDSVLTLDEDSIVVSVNGVTIDTYRYSLTTSDLEDDCTFEIEIDLVSLVEAGILTADKDGNYQDIVITYSATVSEDTEAGDYENTTWITYEADGESDPSTVIVTVPEPEEETEEETTEEQTTEEETTEEVTTEEETAEEETTQTEETEETEEDTPVVGSTGFMIWMILLGAAALCVAVMIARRKITQ